MNKTSTYAMAAVLGALPVTALGADDLDALRRQIEQLKQEYEGRIQALERKLEQAERKPAPAPEVKADKRGQVTSGNAFNPAISIIMDGVYYDDNHDGEGGELAGRLDGIHNAHVHDEEHDEEHGHAHGGVEQGFNLRDVELAVSTSVDPYFDARAQIVFSEDGVEVEEAYFLTRNLPAGLQVKGGKFLSDIGYANNQHLHQWDFTDQNLPYQVLLGGHGLSDNGLQLSWLPAWDVYSRFGFELFQGRNEKMVAHLDEHHYEFEDASTGSASEFELPLDEKKSGPRMWTLFGKFAPDLGYDHALQGGLFYVRSTQYQGLHEDEADEPGDSTHALQGKSWLWGTEWVYKYDSGRAYGQGDLRVQAEYLYQVKDLDVVYHAARPAAVGQQRKFTEDGLYVQAVYGFAPRWEGAFRYDVVGLTNKLEGPNVTIREWDSSNRWGLAVAFRPTEYSLLRAQFTRGDYTIGGEEESLDQFWLQYQLSLGVHGAHSF